jgi:hypothetical protein
MKPVTFQRIYRDCGPDVEHPATPEAVANVIRTMNGAGELSPFKTRFRFADGSSVLVSPKRGKRK